MNHSQNSPASASPLILNPKSKLSCETLNSMEACRKRWIATESKKSNPDLSRIQAWNIEILDITRRRMDLTDPAGKTHVPEAKRASWALSDLVSSVRRSFFSKFGKKESS